MYADVANAACGVRPIGAAVAIPVCNERDHIVGCLRALDAQQGIDADRFGVLLFLNNCLDGTEHVVAEVTPALSYRLRVVLRDHPEASAGWARRCAMDEAAAWLARNLAGLAAGADVVAGRLSLDPDDAALLPDALRARGALEGEYEALATEIAASIDPTPGNAWPTHWCCSGASLAVRLDAYRSIGGMPDMPCGEDRAFVQAALARDLVVRHDPELVVTTSGRLLGRAKGGVADTIRLRCENPESACDDRLERLERIVARALLRRHLRRLHAAGNRAAIRRWALALSVKADAARRVSEFPFFGATMAALEAACPRLAYRPLRPAALPRQIRRARTLLAALRAIASGSAGATPTEAASRPNLLTPDRTAVEACD